MFSLTLIAVHVRFLVVIPLFFVCESAVAPQMSEFARYLTRSGVVPDGSLRGLASAIQRVSRMSNSGKWEIVIFLAALAMPLLESFGSFSSRTGSWETALKSPGGGASWVTVWFPGFCLPLFRYLMLRWLWRLGLWGYFLWRLKKLQLCLIPTHSDGAAGLGYLEIVQAQFAPLAMALSALLSAQLAEEISGGAMALRPFTFWFPCSSYWRRQCSWARSCCSSRNSGSAVPEG